ncbi:DUF881 domain-containing protein [Nocardioides solisilvae]|uniref:DUF881 domain-containing protein n=1 Tax=Nocardioides solisilvae TaxID=1542435 RepID=UPI000D74ABA2|nr:DUF881 domain-containing protein [Nocardioides solisilvae]
MTGPGRPAGPGGEGAEQRGPLPQHVTQPLLSLVTEQSMDQDYQHVAARRGQRPVPEEDGGRGRRVVTAAAVAVFGLLVAVAAVQTSRNADVAALSRASLVSRVQEQRADVRALQDRAGELRAANTTAEESARALREREEEVRQEVSRLGVRTGSLAVRGPGIRVTVASAPGATERQVVQDDDLLYLVDGLWAAGAEAIAINGQRLTTLSSIQNSGDAIHVNVRPVNPPYVVSVVGDPDTLEARLLRTTHGAVFYALARSLEFEFRIQEDDELELPAARVRPLPHAREHVPGRSSKEKELEP